MYQLALLWEAVFTFSDFFWKILSMKLPILWWVIYKYTCPHGDECSVVFDQKPAWPLCPTLPIHWISPHTTLFCFPWMKKGNRFADVEEVKKKNSSSTKKHQNWWVWNLFLRPFEKMSRLVDCIKWRVLGRWLALKRVRINTQFFINSVFWGVPLHI